MEVVLFLGVGLVLLVAVVRLGLPALLRRFGLHRPYRGEAYALPGKRALIITTSHDRLGDTGKPTGVFASEMTVPYYEFLDAGMEVDIASVKGGHVPIEADSLRWPLATDADRRYLADPAFRAKTDASHPITEVDIAAYDIVFLAGGWGAAYDLGTSEVLGTQISRAWAAGKVVGGVCHGPLGLLKAVDTDGQPLVKGRTLTAVTDRQISQLGIVHTPMHPERDLRAAGSDFRSRRAVFDIFADLTVEDGRLVTGQNQNAGAETAHKMMRAAGGRPRQS
ncbi:type 1 glutamine amidotransferase domain-containing protein [Oleisolibacter albus]|uniref:type 1 glutamine amidotransferase domain-containing protein n=1 Tax=Oleisolibacter albus TaxID=2171757 RepID=UPI000DF3296B|nr:type 1 glutamine amidotransferase domain-containing protein [Oleisolibacter albus]